MKKSKRLEPVVRVAQAKEQHAAQALGHAQVELQSQTARLDELHNYEQEYQKRFLEAGQIGASAQQLRGFSVFLANIKKAIEQQKRVVDTTRKLVEEKKQQWFTRRSKTKAIDSVVTNYRNVERKELDRKEQAESDDRSQHMLKNR